MDDTDLCPNCQDYLHPADSECYKCNFTKTPNVQNTQNQNYRDYLEQRNLDYLDGHDIYTQDFWDY